MLLLALDLSTHTGWSVFEDGKLKDYGLLEVEVKDMDFQDLEDSPGYPKNLITASARSCLSN